jgi:hypothetical protein
VATQSSRSKAKPPPSYLPSPGRWASKSPHWHGRSVGSDLEFADEVTIWKAMEGRRRCQCRISPLFEQSELVPRQIASQPGLLLNASSALQAPKLRGLAVQTAVPANEFSVWRPGGLLSIATSPIW